MASRAARPRVPPVALALAPGMVALGALALAPLWPDDQVWGQVLIAGCYSLPRWLLALWPVWSVVCGVLGGRWLRHLALGLVAFLLSGLPTGRYHRAKGALDWEDGAGLRLVSSNVNAFSDHEDPAPMEQALGALRADVVVVIEKRALSIPGMVRVADNFDRPMDRVSHGTAVFCVSAAPGVLTGRPDPECQAEITEEFGTERSHMPLALVRARLGAGHLCVLGIHSPPPAPRYPDGILPYLRKVVGAVSRGRMARAWGPCQLGDPVLVMGDLNQVPGSPAHRILVDADLDDVLAGWGPAGASWPSGGGWPDLPLFHLDHIFAGAVGVLGAHQVRVPGTDHKALKARVVPR